MKRSSVYLILLLVILPFFQNCKLIGSSDGQSSQLSLSNTTDGGGNGHGYDGKIYSNYLEGTAFCPTGSKINSQIEFRKDQAFLIRENCADIEKSQQQAVQVSIDPANPNLIYYLDRAYYYKVVQLNFKLFPESSSVHQTAKLVSGHVYPQDSNGNLVTTVNFFGLYDHSLKRIWSKNFTGYFDRFTFASSQATSSGTSVITNIKNGRRLILSIDQNGNVIANFSQTLPAHLNLGSSLIDPTSGATYSTAVSKEGANFRTVVIQKVSLQGTIEWERSLIGSTGTNSVADSSLSLFKNGDILLRSNVEPGVQTLTRISAIGQTLWSKKYLSSSISFSTLDDGRIFASDTIYLQEPGAPTWYRRSYRQHFILDSDGIPSLGFHLNQGTALNRDDISLTGLTSDPEGNFLGTIQETNRSVSVKMNSSFQLLWAWRYVAGQFSKFTGLRIMNNELIGTLTTDPPIGATYQTTSIARYNFSDFEAGCSFCQTTTYNISYNEPLPSYQSGPLPITSREIEIQMEPLPVFEDLDPALDPF